MKRIGTIFLTIIMALALVSCGKAKVDGDFHTELQRKYLADDYKNFSLYAKGTEELSYPAPIVIKGSDKSEYTVYIGNEEDLSDAVALNYGYSDLKLYNLELGRTYYYKVVVNGNEGRIQSFTTTSQAPRNLYIDGITNFRDLGGWSTADGKTVKQGMVFRSAKFNADESTDTLLTEEGKKAIAELGIKTELDLRSSDDNETGGITESPIPGADYVNVPLESGGNIILLNKDKLKDIFAVFGDEANYPVVVHCSIGTDRTGMVAFLINGLLGVAEEDLYRDFLFSNFGNIGSMRTQTIIKTYMDTIEMASGNTLSEQIRNYLISQGVEASDLDTLVKMLSE